MIIFPRHCFVFHFVFIIAFCFSGAEKVDLVINRCPPFLSLLPNILCLSIRNCYDSGGDTNPKISKYLFRLSITKYLIQL